MTTNNIKARVNQEMLSMYHSGSVFLEEYPWEFESDRLAELIVLLFMSLAIEPKKARASVEALNRLGMISGLPQGDLSDEQYDFMQRVLIQSGIEKEKASVAIKLVIRVILQIRKKWGGYIQRMLRKWGTQMATDLGGTLAKAGLDQGQAMAVATSWLQNVANLPILAVRDPHVKNFLKEFRITENEFTQYLDDLGLNVCVADELLTVRSLEKAEGNGATKKTNSKKKRK
jgi:hypothetical protein